MKMETQIYLFICGTLHPDVLYCVGRFRVHQEICQIYIKCEQSDISA